jgi:hypothetical protein
MTTTAPATFTKPFFLLSTKEQLIAERDYMEANWQDSFRVRMVEISRLSVQKFGVTIANLSI